MFRAPKTNLMMQICLL